MAVYLWPLYREFQALPFSSLLKSIQINISQAIIFRQLSLNGMDLMRKLKLYVKLTFTVETAPDHVANNWNVARASPKGTFFGGTFRGVICGNTSAPLGGVYSYDKKCGVKDLKSPNIRSSSGFAFNIQGNKLYNVAPCNYVIREFDYDKKTEKTSKFKKSHQKI